jgi:hypothetical protein
LWLGSILKTVLDVEIVGKCYGGRLSIYWPNDEGREKESLCGKK